MSNFGIVNGIKTAGNGRQNPLDWEGAGFIQVDWNKFSYTWQGDFPVFTVAPGVHDGQRGMVARHEASGTVELFPYQTCPHKISAQLNDLIYEIISREDDLIIDIDDYMLAGLPQTSGPIPRPGEEYAAEVV